MARQLLMLKIRIFLLLFLSLLVQLNIKFSKVYVRLDVDIRAKNGRNNKNKARKGQKVIRCLG